MAAHPQSRTRTSAKPAARHPSRTQALHRKRVRPRTAKRGTPAPSPSHGHSRSASGTDHHSAALELEHFVALLQKCKRAVSGFSAEQKQRLRAIMSRAHQAIERLHG